MLNENKNETTNHGFIVVPNIYSSFGFKHQSYNDIKAAVAAWYDEPSLDYASSDKIREAIGSDYLLNATTEPSLIADTKNIWYQFEDTEQYELTLISSINGGENTGLATQMFFYDGGTYIRQISDDRSLEEQLHDSSLVKYLHHKKLPTPKIISEISRSSHSGSIKYDGFIIQYIFTIDPKTKKQLLEGLACLQVMEKSGE